MIGQRALLDTVDKWVQADTTPRFIIISGPKGGGKYTASREIAKKLHATPVMSGLLVADVREAIATAYKSVNPVVYIFTDADKMSTAAMNALLKVTEEPPRKAYFILTVENLGNVLATLISRATTLSLTSYTAEELDEFFEERTVQKNPLVRQICSTPGMMLQLEKENVDELLSFCSTIVDNVQLVTGVNALKIVQRIKLKDGGPGYDADLFFECMKYVLFERVREGDALQQLYATMLKLTYEYHRKLKITGTKKDAVLDMWILAMREADKV